jgi:hypothetical protein
MTHPHDSGPAATDLLALLPAPRLAPYVKAASGDPSVALSLYEWSSRMASAAFEDVGHLEVLFRETLDRALQAHYRESDVGIPWFLLPTPGGEQVVAAIDIVRARLRAQGRETRDQIVAGLSFGFWSGIVGPKYDDLAGFIHPDAKSWLETFSRAMDVYAQRPAPAQDTVVVPARDAWPFYEEHKAYVCQPGRSFRPVERIAFYADQEIKPDVPRISHRRDDVEWTEAAASRLEGSDNRDDRKIATIIQKTLADGWTEGSRQVFLLSRRGDASHRALVSALPHETGGRGSAFVQRQRYVSLHALEIAQSTRDLVGPSSG